MRASFKHITKVKTQNGEMTFGENEVIFYRWRTGMDKDTVMDDLIPREYHDYELEDGTVLLDVSKYDIKLEW
jgi:hypothetical protein